MTYFIIAGEASGDLHASHLMKALLEQDSSARFFFYGGERMKKVGGTMLRHYRDMAYMGFIPVLLHLRTILSVMRECKQQILEINPDVVILVDYPGFNLQIARYVHFHTRIPIYYYISPKIWAWKEHRIRQIRQYVDEMFSILPFEVDFYEKKHHYPIHYVGNPTVDELQAFKQTYTQSFQEFASQHDLLPSRKIIALLPGSRHQEIKDNLLIMSQAAKPFVSQGYQIVIAGVSQFETTYYQQFCPELCEGQSGFSLLTDVTPQLLTHSQAALVTSGTATLETALFQVPQVVCYYAPCGRLVRLLKRMFLKVSFISLVNLIAGKEVVAELIGDQMNARNLNTHLQQILPTGTHYQHVLHGYQEMIFKLGELGAPQRAAVIMYQKLSK